MQTRRITQWAAVAVLAASAIALAGCVGSGSDKAGGVEKQEPIVLKLASFTDDIQAATPGVRRGGREAVGRDDADRVRAAVAAG
jgi:hypothetical protein